MPCHRRVAEFRESRGDLRWEIASRHLRVGIAVTGEELCDIASVFTTERRPEWRRQQPT